MLDNLRADAHPLPEYRHIGRRGPRRIDGIQKASGSADYTMDVQLGHWHSQAPASGGGTRSIVNGSQS